MKYVNFSKKVISAGVLAVSLSILPSALPASAQVDPTPSGPVMDNTPFQESTNDFNNFGWLGLLGLIGLANLFRKPRTVETLHQPDATNRTVTRD